MARNNSISAKRLDEMIRACRSIGGGSLSETARARILGEASRPAPVAGLRALFTPTRHLLVAATLPVVLAVALLVGFDPGVQSPAAGLDETPRVAVSKENGHIMFSIQNGGRQHIVYRSTDPRGFDARGGVPVTGGAYEERLQDQADLVFYRID